MQTELEHAAIARSSAEAATAFAVKPRVSDTARELHLLELARKFLAAIETDTALGRDAADTALAFYAVDVLQEEFPNRFVPTGAQRDLAALREAAKRGKGVMRSQRFEPRSAHASGDTVILELLWVGTLAVDIGALKAGDEMRAHLGVFLQYRGDSIVRHRTYDCFEPF